jgi:hypothetical protein
VERRQGPPSTRKPEGQQTMTQPYTIDHDSNWRREAVRAWLFGLDLVSAELQDRIVTAWVSTWASSTHETLEDMPFSPAGGFFPLARHVN